MVLAIHWKQKMQHWKKLAKMVMMLGSFGWKPKQEFGKSLTETINWYLENQNEWKHLATKQMLTPTPWKKYRK